MNTLPLTLDSLSLMAGERRLCVAALSAAGNIVEAAKLLGITRHAMKRRMVKHKIEVPRRGNE